MSVNLVVLDSNSSATGTQSELLSRGKRQFDAQDCSECPNKQITSYGKKMNMLEKQMQDQDGKCVIQLELPETSQDMSFDSERYHAIGYMHDGKLLFLPYQENDPALLQPLIKSHLDIECLDASFEHSIFHVYFADTDYPILYQHVNAALHFELPGSNVNYDDLELGKNPGTYSRVKANYFNDLLIYDKPLNEIFRNFQFNGIDCNDVREIVMNGNSLGGAMQQFLLAYILQNIHMFNNLHHIILNVAAPSCFHSKIITSLNRQFNDALLRIPNPLEITMNYTMHLKDAVVRRGNPFALQYTGTTSEHKITYNVELYAYCEEEKCDHRMSDFPSHKYTCNTVPNGDNAKKYHTRPAILHKHTYYRKLSTSNFKIIQNLIDNFFLSQNCFDVFKKFFFNLYGDDCLKYPHAHMLILKHEKLADEMLKKYKIDSAVWDHKRTHLRNEITRLESVSGIRELKALAEKNVLITTEQVALQLKYLDLCSAKSELAKLIAAKSN